MRTEKRCVQGIKQYRSVVVVVVGGGGDDIQKD